MLTPEQKQEVVTLRTVNGYSLEAISKMFNLSRERIRQILAKFNVRGLVSPTVKLNSFLTANHLTLDEFRLELRTNVYKFLAVKYNVPLSFINAAAHSLGVYKNTKESIVWLENYIAELTPEKAFDLGYMSSRISFIPFATVIGYSSDRLEYITKLKTKLEIASSGSLHVGQTGDVLQKQLRITRKTVIKYFMDLLGKNKKERKIPVNYLPLKLAVLAGYVYGQRRKVDSKYFKVEPVFLESLRLDKPLKEYEDMINKIILERTK